MNRATARKSPGPSAKPNDAVQALRQTAVKMAAPTKKPKMHRAVLTARLQCEWKEGEMRRGNRQTGFGRIGRLRGRPLVQTRSQRMQFKLRARPPSRWQRPVRAKKKTPEGLTRTGLIMEGSPLRHPTRAKTARAGTLARSDRSRGKALTAVLAGQTIPLFGRRKKKGFAQTKKSLTRQLHRRRFCSGQSLQESFPAIPFDLFKWLRLRFLISRTIAAPDAHLLPSLQLCLERGMHHEATAADRSRHLQPWRSGFQRTGNPWNYRQTL